MYRVIYVSCVHSRSDGCGCPLTCLHASRSMLRVQVCSLTLAMVSCFWIINGHKLIAMSQCHIHHRLTIEDFVWEAVVRGLQGPDVCVLSFGFSPDRFGLDWR